MQAATHLREVALHSIYIRSAALSQFVFSHLLSILRVPWPLPCWKLRQVSSAITPCRAGASRSVLRRLPPPARAVCLAPCWASCTTQHGAPSQRTPCRQRQLLAGAVCRVQPPPDAHRLPSLAEVAPGAVCGVDSPPCAHAEQRRDDDLELRRQQLACVRGRLQSSPNAHGWSLNVSKFVGMTSSSGASSWLASVGGCKAVQMHMAGH